MLKLFLKKNFFSSVETMFTIATLNIGFILASALSIYVLPNFMPNPSKLSHIICLVFGLVIDFFIFSISTYVLFPVSAYCVPSLKNIPKFIKKAILSGLELFFIDTFLFVSIYSAISFYFNMKGFFGILFFVLSVLIISSLFLATQFFIPFKIEGNKFFTAIKLSITQFLYEPKLSIILFCYSLLSIALCPLVAFLFPGFSCVALATCNASKFGSKSMDLKICNNQKKLSSKDIETLFAQDIDELGKKTLKGLIQPWNKKNS